MDLVAGQWRLCRVVQTYCHQYAGDLVGVTVGGETIESTRHHPWWVVRGEELAERPADATVPGRWVDAGDLRVGDLLLLRDGRQLPITALATRSTTEPVYNFCVENLHSYAVGSVQVLVHNNSNQQVKKGGFDVLLNSDGLPARVDARIVGSHPGRGKGYRPEVLGGRAKGHHRGHLAPENGVEASDLPLVNSKLNLISEASTSNLSAKKVFENRLLELADANPNSSVRIISEVHRIPNDPVPKYVMHYIALDGKIIRAALIKNG
jgi:hypothetical protein